MDTKDKRMKDAILGIQSRSMCGCCTLFWRRAKQPEPQPGSSPLNHSHQLVSSWLNSLQQQLARWREIYFLLSIWLCMFTPTDTLYGAHCVFAENSTDLKNFPGTPTAFPLQSLQIDTQSWIIFSSHTHQRQCCIIAWWQLSHSKDFTHSPS